jgi:hypothetical protein
VVGESTFPLPVAGRIFWLITSYATRLALSRVYFYTTDIRYASYVGCFKST